MTRRELIVLTACVLAGMAIGMGTDYLLVALHAVSPDNIAAGAVIGFSGPVAGILAALMITIRDDNRAN